MDVGLLYSAKFSRHNFFADQAQERHFTVHVGCACKNARGKFGDHRLTVRVKSTKTGTIWHYTVYIGTYMYVCMYVRTQGYIQC